MKGIKKKGIMKEREGKGRGMKGKEGGANQSSKGKQKWIKASRLLS